MIALELPDTPVLGPTGAPDNVPRLVKVLSRLMPMGVIPVVDVLHQSGCPCSRGDVGWESCRCEVVDVRVRTIRLLSGREAEA